MKIASVIRKHKLDILSLSNINIINKILFLILITLVFRFLTAIPVPGVPLDALKQILSQYSFGEILNITSSGALASTTLLAIGLGPYINASVVLQLLSSVVPKLEEIQKEGAKGRMIINMYTRLLTLPLALLQSVVIYYFLKSNGLVYVNVNLPGVLTGLEIGSLIASLTGGSILLMWISEILSEDNFVNGSSYIIAAGILADIPGKFSAGLSGVEDYVMAIVVVVTILWVAFVIYITSAERRIPIKHAKVKSFSSKPMKDNYIPLKLNQAGVMPVIFALSFLSTPALVLDLLQKSDWVSKYSWLQTISEFVTKISDTKSIVYNVILALLIFGFSIFYAFVVMNPEERADSLKRQGAFIPGVRPGEESRRYLSKILLRMSIWGGLFLVIVAVLPMVLPNLISSHLNITVPIFFSGTGVLIVIGVMVNILDKFRSLKTERYTLTGI